ncbi:MAG: radical SAM protein [Proteobacteria bacterium]|nr:radical SAM protein [Pseudomonadota bacterium]
MSTTGYFDNPWALKIDLMLRGVRVVDPLAKAWACGTTGIDMLLPEETLVNIPCREEFTEHSPYELRRRGECHYITDGTEEAAAEILPVPEFYSRKTTTGVPFGDIAVVHGSYTVITPSPKCDFFDTDSACRYCTIIPDGTGEPKRDFTVEEVLEAVGAVLKEGLSKIIYLSVGFTDGDDGGIEFLEPYIRAIKKHHSCLVAVEALPPKKNRWIDRTYALGADSILYNMGIYDPELFEVICPGRAELVGRQRYLDALKYAVGIFPNGTVASHLIVGLEPPGSTRIGIDCLTKMGVVPILPIYRPRPGRALRIEPLTTEIIIPVFKHLYTTVKKSGVNFKWVRDISMVTTPAEASMLMEGAAGELTPLKNFYSSRFGLKAAWGLSTIRRKLRVKNTEA